MTYKHSLPSYINYTLEKAYTSKELERIVYGYHAKRPVTFRTNILLSTRKQVKDALERQGLSYRAVEWYDNAFILDEGRESSLWDKPLYQSGHIYLQSLSSMLPPLIFNPSKRGDILDMCAAPGGKTSLIASLFPDCPLTACEIKRSRYEKLLYNLEKLGVSNVTVMKMDARKLDDFFTFNAILVDAPCSGSGTIDLSKDDPFRYITKKLMDSCISSQRQLLEKACKLVKVGGEIIYSTCSIFKEENEDVVKGVLGEKKNRSRFKLQPIPLLEEYTFPFLQSSLEHVYTLCPDELFEGFFIAKIKRVR